VTQLAGKMLLKGTRSRSAEDIAREIESVGGSVDSYGGNNSFGVNAEVMSGDFAVGLNLVADVLLNPTFPEQSFEREREVQLAGIRAQRDQLLQSASRAMRQALFGNIGYGLDALGSEASVQNLKITDLKDFHERLARPENCVFAIFGDVHPNDVRAAVENVFGSWPMGTARRDTLPPRVPLNEIKRLSETRDKKQAVLVVGFEGTTLHDPDRYALELLQESCSDLGSRLFIRIRETLGLAYYVGAQNFIGLAPGYFAFYAGTSPEKADQVEQELLAEAELLRQHGLTEEELKRAKAKVIGQKKIARQDLGGLAMACSLDELYGLGYDHSEKDDALYEAVTVQDVQRVAGKYLSPKAFVVSVVRP
jgi:zinc protease